VSQAVVDTDVVSFLFKQDTRGIPYAQHLAGVTPLVSFMTLAELDYWALSARWGSARRQQMERFLQQFTIVLSDRDLCQRWADVYYACRRAGRPIQTSDAWIAATALHFGAPLLTHNRADFAAVPGLTVVSAAP
jgi:predicted nucleic acid-binding protein